MKLSKKKLLLEVFTQLFFLILAFVGIFFIRNEFVVSFGVILLLVLNFLIKYYSKEWLLFTLGTIIGFLVEIGLSRIYKMQYWDQGSFFGIPLWLPLAWGYGFFFIRRIGNLIVKD